VTDRVKLSHPDKVLFPDDGITKADLAAYYLTVAPLMLPLVSGRPVTMQRFPNGIGRGGFLQKQIGDYFPGWIERVTAPNRRTRTATTREEVTCVVCRAADDLAYLANQACITPHVWLSRAPAIWRTAAQFLGGQQSPGGGGAGHVQDRCKAVAVWDSTVPAAVRGPRWGRQQGLHQRPQRIRHQVVNEGRHGGILPDLPQASETTS
jgi:hypothetical protein